MTPASVLIFGRTFALKSVVSLFTGGKNQQDKEVSGKVHFYLGKLCSCVKETHNLILCPSLASILHFLLGDGYVIKLSSCSWSPVREETVNAVFNYGNSNESASRREKRPSHSVPMAFLPYIALTNPFISTASVRRETLMLTD